MVMVQRSAIDTGNAIADFMFSPRESSRVLAANLKTQLSAEKSRDSLIGAGAFIAATMFMPLGKASSLVETEGIVGSRATDTIGSLAKTKKIIGYHATDKAEEILREGFKLPKMKTTNRFLKGVYSTDSPSAALAERGMKDVLEVEIDLGKNLDITKMGPVHDQKIAQSIARGARKHDYDSIRTRSVQEKGGINTVIFDVNRVRPIRKVE